MNPARWYEYSFSASLMIFIIGMLVTIYDFGTLLALFTLTAVMNLMGLMMEIHNQTTTKTNWTSYTIGCIAGFVPWVVIFIPLITAGSVPDFVIAIFITIAVFFNLFAINMFLQYKKDRKMERLSVRRTNVYRPESRRKICTRLASICWNITAYVNIRNATVPGLLGSVIPHYVSTTTTTSRVLKIPIFFFPVSPNISKKKRFELEV